MSFLLVAIILMCSVATIVADADQEYCDRKWPELDLMMPARLPRTRNFNFDLINSMSIYWPKKRSNVSLLFVLDAEEKGEVLEKDFIKRVIVGKRNETNFPNIEIKYHNKTMKYRNGHDRQQHMMFYPELYTNKEYIGYVDSDTFFTSSVDREDIFEDGKPIVHGRIGPVRKWYQNHYSNTTYNLLGMEEPMICMSYFPVVMKTSHMKDLRDYVAERTGMTFDEAFAKYAMSATFSQFNIMCTYTFWKKRDEYAWTVHDTDPKWDGINNPKPFYGQWGQKWVFPNSSFAVKPFITMHVRYHHLGGKFDIANVMARSMCHTRPDNNPAGLNCTDYLLKYKLYDHMFRFEDANYKTVIDRHILLDAQLQRQKRFDNCDISYGKEQFWKNFPGKTLQDVQKILLNC